MRNYYDELIAEKIWPEATENQLPILPKANMGSNGTPFVSNDSAIQVAPDNQNAEDTVIKALSNLYGGHPSRIHEYNSIDVYNAKLEKVRKDPKLAAEFEDICEKRMAIMIENGSDPSEAEAYVADLEFLTKTLMSM